MMLVYTAGPIAAAHGYTIEQNVQSAVTVYFHLIASGVNAFCPHLGALHPEAFDISYERWLQYDFAMLNQCSHVLMLARWDTSPGACREHDYALKQGKTVCYHVDDILHTELGDGVGI